MTRGLIGRVLVVVGAGGLVLGACGGAGGGDSSVRTVGIDMHDIAYSPASVHVRSGETVRFVFHNKGRIRHDAYIGDESEQQAHEAEIREAEASPSGAMHGMSHEGMTAAGGIAVEPGKTGELTHTFGADDRLLIGCHESGHYAAGMKVDLRAP